MCILLGAHETVFFQSECQRRDKGSWPRFSTSIVSNSESTTDLVETRASQPWCHFLAFPDRDMFVLEPYHLSAVRVSRPTAQVAELNAVSLTFLSGFRAHSNLPRDKIYHCVPHYECTRLCCVSRRQLSEFYQQTDLKFNLFYDRTMFLLIFLFCSFRFNLHFLSLQRLSNTAPLSPPRFWSDSGPP